MLPMQNDSYDQVIDQFEVAWTSLSVSSNDTTYYIESTDFPMSVFLDSTVTFTWIPTDLFDELAGIFGAVYENTTESWMVDCTTGNSSITINFGFGNGAKTIEVPDVELSYPCFDFDGHLCNISNGVGPQCYFGVQPTNADLVITFGQTFLRSAYVLYDLDTLHVGLAQATINSTESEMLQYYPAGQNPRINTWTAGPNVSNYSSIANGSVTAIATSSGWAAYDAYAFGYDAVPTLEAASLVPLTATPTGIPGLGTSSSSSFASSTTSVTSTQSWLNVGGGQAPSTTYSITAPPISSITAVTTPASSTSGANRLHQQVPAWWTVAAAMILIFISSRL